MSKAAFNLEDYAIDNQNAQPFNLEDYAVSKQKRKTISPTSAYGSGIEHVMETIPHGIVNAFTDEPQGEPNQIPQSFWTDTRNANLWAPEGYKQKQVNPLAQKLNEIFKNARQRQNAKYEQAVEQHPRSASWGTTSGEVLKAAPVLAAGGPLGFAGRTGAVAGGLHGLIKGSEEGRNPLQNLIEGGLEGAQYGMLADPLVNPFLKKAGNLSLNLGKELINEGKGLKKEIDTLRTAYPPKETGNRILKDLSKNEANVAKDYDSWKTASKESGVDFGFPKMPKMEKTKFLKSLKKQDPSIRTILNDGPVALKYTIKNKWLKNPNVDNTHDLIKDLRLFQRKKGTKGLSIKDSDVVSATEKLEKQLINKMNKSYLDQGHPELAEALKKADINYIENVRPYRLKPIEEFKAGNLTAEDLMKNLSTNKLFKAKLAEKYPQVEVYEAYKPLFEGERGIFKKAFAKAVTVGTKK